MPRRVAWHIPRGVSWTSSSSLLQGACLQGAWRVPCCPWRVPCCPFVLPWISLPIVFASSTCSFGGLGGNASCAGVGYYKNIRKKSKRKNAGKTQLSHHHTPYTHTHRCSHTDQRERKYTSSPPKPMQLPKTFDRTPPSTQWIGTGPSPIPRVVHVHRKFDRFQKTLVCY